VVGWTDVIYRLVADTSDRADGARTFRARIQYLRGREAGSVHRANLGPTRAHQAVERAREQWLNEPSPVDARILVYARHVTTHRSVRPR
jgi:hypothetical protein